MGNVRDALAWYERDLTLADLVATRGDEAVDGIVAVIHPVVASTGQPVTDGDGADRPDDDAS